jgi:transcriptional regulator GlxA family with amidase domain
MTKVTVVEIQGCMASSAAITHDVMATANQISGSAKRALPFNVTTVRCGPRRSSGKLRNTDLIIVPGLGTASEDELNAKLQSPACRRLRDVLVDAFESGAMLAAPCASTFLLAETGLLDGRRATTTWWLAPLFRRRYPKVELVTDRIVVADWPIATGGAAMAQMDLMLAIVRRFAAPSLAKACANYLLLDERHSQAPFMAIAYLANQDPKIAKAERRVRDNITRDFTVDELAEAVALAPRTFARRIAGICGVSPIRFVQRIRIETARYLLETTRLSVEEIGRGAAHRGQHRQAAGAAAAVRSRKALSIVTFWDDNSVTGRGNYCVQNARCKPRSKREDEDAFVHHLCLVFPFRRKGTCR